MLVSKEIQKRLELFTAAKVRLRALLEILVHFEIDVRDLPTRYRLLKLRAPDALVVEHLLRPILRRTGSNKRIGRVQ